MNRALSLFLLALVFSGCVYPHAWEGPGGMQAFYRDLEVCKAKAPARWCQGLQCSSMEVEEERRLTVCLKARGWHTTGIAHVAGSDTYKGE